MTKLLLIALCVLGFSHEDAVVYSLTQPDPGRYWDMIQRHKITQFYTAPTGKFQPCQPTAFLHTSVSHPHACPNLRRSHSFAHALWR
jgi:hypothetical protein